MSWTYSDSLTLPRDQIRFAIGDTDTNDQLLSDGEIAYCYSKGGSVLDGSIIAARATAARLAREFDADLDGLNTKRSQRHKQLLAIIAQLEAERDQGSYTSSVPGIGKVADTSSYPARFEPSDEAGADWG